MSDMSIRTRIAPSPTGEDIHIGNLYTALMNYAWARKNAGKFIVRIEDTDRERFVKGAEQKILGSLQAYGLTPDEGPHKGGPFAPYRQSERLQVYKEHAEELIEVGKAYYCFCTKERLDELRKKQIAEKKTPRYDKYCLTNVKNAKEKIETGEPYVVRLNVPRDRKVAFLDLIRGEIVFETNNIDDQVLLKSDGYPTYHLGVVVDDHLMEISHVIRAEEWISSTPKHILLYEAFGWNLPVFAHVPILRNPDKSKLSKRKNPVWSQWYLDEGYLPEAVLNYLSLMGWSHPGEKEIFSLEEFVSIFDLKDLKPVGPVFDIVKLRWMNGEYIRRMGDEELFNKLKSYYKGDEEVTEVLKGDEAFVHLLIGLSKTRLETLKDFKELLFEKKVTYRNNTEKKIVEDLQIQLSRLSDWRKEAIFAEFKEVMNKYNVRMPVLYYLFTGKERGLPLPDMLAGMGKDKALDRLRLIT